MTWGFLSLGISGIEVRRKFRRSRRIFPSGSIASPSILGTATTLFCRRTMCTIMLLALDFESRGAVAESRRPEHRSNWESSMPRAAGDADKLGNHYEAIWTVDAILDVFFGKAHSITVESLGDGSEGVEFHLEGNETQVEFHSVKRQKQGGDWSIADLCRQDTKTGRSILADLFNKRRAYGNAKLKFISATITSQGSGAVYELDKGTVRFLDRPATSSPSPPSDRPPCFKT